MAEVSWHLHADVLLVMFGLVAAYVAAVVVLGPRLADPGESIATTRQKALFLTGVGVLLIGAYWPIHDIAEDFLFSVHMVQHTVFSLVAPPLLLLGMPPWLLRALIRPIAGVMRRLTRPLVAFVLFNGFFVFSHWPLVVDAAVRSEPLHFLLHVALVGTSLLMWWPVVGPLPEFPQLSPPGKMLYLFIQSILPTVPASFLTFSTGVIYKAYAEFPRLWGISVVTDQRMAGLFMKLGGGLLLWSVIAVLFFKWNAEEQRGIQDLSWNDFERELEAYKLRE